MPHMSTKELQAYLYERWKHGISEAEREDYVPISKAGEQAYFEKLSAANERINNLRQRIHEIKFTSDNPSVKPSGKLRFLSAFRFFRREAIPQIKEDHPELDSRARHVIVRNQWMALGEDKKYVFVMMSRLDKEKAIFTNRLSQIKQNLLDKFPEAATCDSESQFLSEVDCFTDLIKYDDATRRSHEINAVSTLCQRIDKQIQEERKVLDEDDPETDENDHTVSVGSSSLSGICVANPHSKLTFTDGTLSFVCSQSSPKSILKEARSNIEVLEEQS